jgi:hypothetical protein
MSLTFLAGKMGIQKILNLLPLITITMLSKVMIATMRVRSLQTKS